jgi:hypothetical protein
MDPGIGIAIEVGSKLLPAVIGLVQGLIAAGHSPEEATAIVRRDIESRRAEYERMKAEDVAALNRKHGRGSEKLTDAVLTATSEFEEP